MSNKAFLVLLGGCVITIITVLATVAGFVPSFLAPFVIAVYGLYIIYMTR